MNVAIIKSLIKPLPLLEGNADQTNEHLHPSFAFFVRWKIEEKTHKVKQM